MIQHKLTIHTQGRNSYDISDKVAAIVTKANVSTGICHLFIKHTSASLMISENADITVRQDLELLFARLAPDGDPDYQHTLEGPDDMSAHARSVLTCTSLSVPICNGQLGLGTWQGIYLWEHRRVAHRRTIIITIAS